MTDTQQKIVPHLWFDTQAKEAAEFYCSLFPDSRVTNVTTLRNTPSGDTDIVSFELSRYQFQAISAGPLFEFNPSISFMVNFDPSQDAQARRRIDDVWAKLIEGGEALMPLDQYPFSERYGWVKDRYGLTWQLILTDPAGEPRPFIIPSLLFVGDVHGKAEDASEFYLSVFRDGRRGTIARYPGGMEPEQEGTVMFTDIELQGQWFALMDSAQDHRFAFNEAVSLMVYCEDQQEIDYYWSKLSAVPEAEQCGWIKDKYGVSWQIVPADLDRMMAKGDRAALDRVTQAFLSMKKFDIAALARAYEGR
jgi:predicted 3-demethylubiquinone-9 3-methyltransferase (glyoxalase superfamily)